MSTKFAKPAELFAVWYMAQIGPASETIFGRLLDYGVSFALLGLIAFIFYREWKSSSDYNKDRDNRMEDLIKNNTEAMGNTKNAINDMREEQKRFREELKNLHERVERNRHDINSWRNT